ncbi:MAG: hypothetical protein KF791_15345 [Verrucomicrobiae bacterium]|nr:hypothetical protein [Verrucomicrobiae bacterium]
MSRVPSVTPSNPASKCSLPTLIAYRGLRGLERLLPPAPLRGLLWPFVAAAAFILALRIPRTNAARIAPLLRPGCPERPWQWRRLVGNLYFRMATFWPDRLRSHRWRDRMRIEGLEPILKARDGGTPVVFATLHLNTLSLMRYLLRAHGIPAATLITNPSRNGLIRLRDEDQDRVTHLGGIPHTFHTDDLRQAVAFLKSGKCLMVACDLGSPRSLRLATRQGTLTVALGAFRLAQATGALLIPALTLQEDPWRFVTHIAPPVALPGNPETDEAFRPAAEQWIRELLPHLERFPSQYDPLNKGVWTP